MIYVILFLDSAILQPVSTGNNHTDEVVNHVLESITTKNMSTTERVQACYNYLVNFGSLDDWGSFTYKDRFNDEQKLHASKMSDDQFKTYGIRRRQLSEIR